MSLADKLQPAPIEVRLAGALTTLPGLGFLAIAVVLVVSSFSEDRLGPSGNIYAEAGYYAVIAAGTLACGVGLFLGHTGARTPSVVVALMEIGIGWYSAGPSSNLLLGVPLILLGLAGLVLLFRRPSRAWAIGQVDGETEEEASERDAAQRRNRHQD